MTVTPEAHPTVLIVEDEPSFVEALMVGLKREGFRPQAVGNGNAALASFEAIKPDVVLLDVMLPDRSGLDVCQEIRRKSSVPIIMVSAKSSEIDTVVGLEMGADDYVAKPYRLRELVARIRAAQRRAPRPREPQGPGTYDIGDVHLDAERHEVLVRGEAVSLPLKEFEVLELLMLNAGRVVTRDTIIDEVWGADYVGDTKTLDVHIKRLRSKIESDNAQPRHIVTIRGLGYRFERDPVPAP
jgi:two-component system, OmpR family, response regulator RegX3